MNFTKDLVTISRLGLLNQLLQGEQNPNVNRVGHDYGIQHDSEGCMNSVEYFEIHRQK